MISYMNPPEQTAVHSCAQVSQAGRWGSVRVAGEAAQEAEAGGAADRLIVKRAPVFLGGAPADSPYLPEAHLYKSGGMHVLHTLLTRCTRLQGMHTGHESRQQEGEGGP
jgi:hypothetical protein